MSNVQRIKIGDMMRNMHTGRVIIIDSLDRDFFAGHYYWNSSQRETYAYTQIDTDVEVYDQTRFDTESIAAIPALDRTPQQEADDRAHEMEFVANYGAGTGTLESRLESFASLEARLEPMGPTTLPRSQKDSSLAAAYTAGAYKGAATEAEEMIRQAREMLITSSAPFEALYLLESAERALRSARHVDDENPYA